MDAIRETLWSAVTCHRFGPGRLDAQLFDRSNVTRSRQVATDQSGDRSPHSKEFVDRLYVE